MSRFFRSMLLLSTITVVGCTTNDAWINSETYFKEELAAYSDIMPELIDAGHWTENLADSSVALFFVFDSLKEVSNDKNDFLTGKFIKRAIGDHDLKTIPKVKLQLVTNFKHDNRILRHEDSITRKNISVRKGEKFTGEWLILSRICFDRTFSKGFLTDSIWTNSSSRKDFIEIEKTNDKWKVTNRIKGLVF